MTDEPPAGRPSGRPPLKLLIGHATVGPYAVRDHPSYPAVRYRLIRVLDPRVQPSAMGRIDALRVMVLFRQVMEIDPDLDTALADEPGGEAVPLVRRFCDWMVHAQLTRTGAVSLMVQVHTAAAAILAQHPPVADGDILGRVAEAVSRVLSMARLRSELLTLCGRHGLATDWCTGGESWAAFVSSLLEELSGKRLGFPEPLATGAESDAKGQTAARREYTRLAGQSLHPTVRTVLSDVRIEQFDEHGGMIWAFRIPNEAVGDVIGQPEYRVLFSVPRPEVAVSIGIPIE